MDSDRDSPFKDGSLENMTPYTSTGTLPDYKKFEEFKYRLMTDISKSTKYSSVNEFTNTFTKTSNNDSSIIEEQESGKQRANSVEASTMSSPSILHQSGMLHRSISYHFGATNQQHTTISFGSNDEIRQRSRLSVPIEFNSRISGICSNHSFKCRKKDAQCSAKLKINAPLSSDPESEINMEDIFSVKPKPTSNKKDKIPAHEALWLIHLLLTFFGINIFYGGENYERLSKRKVVFLIIHLVIGIIMIGYTSYFYFTKPTPAWFVVYTASYAATHLFSILQYLHILFEYQYMIIFWNHFRLIKVEDSISYVMYPLFVIVMTMATIMILFVIIPNEAYGITLALIPSFFMPNILDMYVLTLLWILITEAKELSKNISGTRNWTLKKIRRTNRKMLELRITFVSLNKVRIYIKYNLNSTHTITVQGKRQALSY